MYKFREDKLEEAKKQNLTHMAREIGITYIYLTRVLHSKKNCKKPVAYCITKYLNNKLEINSYFQEI